MLGIVRVSREETKQARKRKMGSGYKITHPEIEVTFNVVLTNEQADRIRNLLAEIGNGGGKVVRMSDLSVNITFDNLVANLNSRF